MKNSQVEELRKKWEENNISYDEIGMLFSAIDILDIKNEENIRCIEEWVNNERVPSNCINKCKIVELERDVYIIKSKFLDINKANNIRHEKIQNVLNLCMNKIKEYESLLQVYKNEEEIIVKWAKVERDLAQQIYTMLF